MIIKIAVATDSQIRGITLQYTKRIIKQPSYLTTGLKFLQSAKSLEGKVLQSATKLKISIVGAGLGGFATACALARRGRDVTCFEQAERLGEVCVLLSRSHSKLFRRYSCTGRRRYSNTTKFRSSAIEMGLGQISERQGRRANKHYIPTLAGRSRDLSH